MELFTVLLLILVGVILVIVEFLLIPGISIAGIGAVISFGFSVYFSFKYWGNLAGIITLIAILVFIPVLLYFLFKSNAIKPMMLHSNIDGKVVNVDEEKIHIGDQGITTGRLAPLGRAKINGMSVEARSLGQFIDQRTPIKVIKIERNTVIVEPINE